VGCGRGLSFVYAKLSAIMVVMVVIVKAVAARVGVITSMLEMHVKEKE
jgi:hypothetical protein